MAVGMAGTTMARTAEPAVGDGGPAVCMPQRSFGAVTEDLLGLIEQAVARIEQGEGAEAALREMQASLLEIKAMVERDPGIRMAADDLYEAAAALVAGKSAGPDLVDIRRWRLLKEAGFRLCARLASAQPSEKARIMGLI
jgi:hypothetical protein